MGFSVQMRRLRGVSDEVLKREALRWRDRERRQTAGLMAHLAEIDRRELYAAWGYSSLFGYCEGALGLTEAEAYLRIQVARTAGRCPAILDRLTSGAMTLSVAAVISPVLTVENAGEVLDRASGMTKVEAKELVVEYRPKPRVESGVRKRPVASDKALKKASLEKKETQVGLLGEGSGSELTAEDCLGLEDGELEKPQVPAGKLEPVERDLYNFRFCADRELKERIERLGEVLGVVDPFGSLDRIVSEAVEVLLDKKDPERREARRKQRAARKVGTVGADKDVESSGDSFRTESLETESIEEESVPASFAQADSVQVGSVQTESGSSRSRVIAIGVRDRVLGRSGFQCEFVHGGRRCQERTGLEVDHVVPFGRGGSNGESNLQVLCGSHNRWKAKEDYGRSYIERKVATARSEVGIDSAERVKEHRWEFYRGTPAAVLSAGRLVSETGY